MPTIPIFTSEDRLPRKLGPLSYVRCRGSDDPAQGWSFRYESPQTQSSWCAATVIIYFNNGVLGGLMPPPVGPPCGDDAFAELENSFDRLRDAYESEGFDIDDDDHETEQVVLCRLPRRDEHADQFGWLQKTLFAERDEGREAHSVLMRVDDRAYHKILFSRKLDFPNAQEALVAVGEEWRRAVLSPQTTNISATSSSSRIGENYNPPASSPPKEEAKRRPWWKWWGPGQ